MADSALGAIANVVGGALSGVGQSVMNQQAAMQQQKYTRENMEQAQRNQLQLMRLATPYAAQGMRDAGMSITGMNGPMSPSSAGGAPVGASVAPVDMAGMMKAFSENRLLNAEADIKEKEAARMGNEDSGSRDYAIQVMTDRLNAMRSAGVPEKYLNDVKGRIEQLSQNKNFNMGDFKAWQAAIAADSGAFKNLTDNLNNISQQANKIWEMRNDAYLPFNLKWNKLQLLMAEVGLTTSKENLTDEELYQVKKNLEVMDKTKEKMDAEIEKLKADKKLTDQQYKQLRNNDINSLLEDGEIKDAMRTYGVNNLADLLKALIFAKGLKSAGGLAAAGKSTPSAIGKGSEIKFNPNQQQSSLGRLADFKLKKPSPFKYDSVDDRAYKGLAARNGENKAFEAYGDWLKNRRLRQSFNDYIYEKWLSKQHNMYDLY